MDWQQIESAPQDETLVLLFCPGDDRPILTAFWSGDWFEHEWSGNPVLYPPTHWMPLPEPPQT